MKLLSRRQTVSLLLMALTLILIGCGGILITVVRPFGLIVVAVGLIVATLPQILGVPRWTRIAFLLCALVFLGLASGLVPKLAWLDDTQGRGEASPNYLGPPPQRPLPRERIEFPIQRPFKPSLP